MYSVFYNSEAVRFALPAAATLTQLDATRYELANPDAGESTTLSFDAPVESSTAEASDVWMQMASAGIDTEVLDDLILREFL